MKITKSYKKYLKNLFYKVLCLFEEENKELTLFLGSIIYELEGLEYVDNSNDHVMIVLLSVLEHFYDDSLFEDYDIDTIRREVFKCINLIESSFKVGDGK